MTGARSSLDALERVEKFVGKQSKGAIGRSKKCRCSNIKNITSSLPLLPFLEGKWTRFLDIVRFHVRFQCGRSNYRRGIRLIAWQCSCPACPRLTRYHAPKFRRLCTRADPDALADFKLLKGEGSWFYSRGLVRIFGGRWSERLRDVSLNSK